uniref:WASH complex subunit 3 n=1 Tax=Amphiprion percula TaxID=161767 RepID=A0A3P8SJK2_AMPPE
MDEDGLPIVGSGVDLTKVPAIQQRRIVAYLNQFVVHTVRFLNRFSTVCEEKLANISLRIQQIETTLCILEAKVSSSVILSAVYLTVHTFHPAQSSQEAAPMQTAEATVNENVMTVAKDPRYARYLKMVHVGVPVMAIRNKMVMDGLDPNLLDTPDAPVPDGGMKSAEDQDVAATSSDSELSFSD